MIDTEDEILIDKIVEGVIMELAARDIDKLDGDQIYFTGTGETRIFEYAMSDTPYKATHVRIEFDGKKYDGAKFADVGGKVVLEFIPNLGTTVIITVTR